MADEHYRVFEFDLGTDTMKCSICERAGSNCTLATPTRINWCRVTTTMNEHLGRAGGSKKDRGAMHRKSLAKLEENQQIQERQSNENSLPPHRLFNKD